LLEGAIEETKMYNHFCKVNKNKKEMKNKERTKTYTIERKQHNVQQNNQQQQQQQHQAQKKDRRNLAIQTFRAFQNSRTWCRRRKVHVNLRNLYKMDMVLALAAAEDFYSTKKLCTLHHVSLILSTREFCSYKKHLSKM
jgi:hypothetical protein